MLEIEFEIIVYICLLDYFYSMFLVFIITIVTAVIMTSNRDAYCQEMPFQRPELFCGVPDWWYTHPLDEVIDVASLRSSFCSGEHVTVACQLPTVATTASQVEYHKSRLFALGPSGDGIDSSNGNFQIEREEVAVSGMSFLDF